MPDVSVDTDEANDEQCSGRHTANQSARKLGTEATESFNASRPLTRLASVKNDPLHPHRLLEGGRGLGGLPGSPQRSKNPSHPHQRGLWARVEDVRRVLGRGTGREGESSLVAAMPWSMFRRCFSCFCAAPSDEGFLLGEATLARHAVFQLDVT